MKRATRLDISYVQHSIKMALTCRTICVNVLPIASLPFTRMCRVASRRLHETLQDFVVAICHRVCQIVIADGCASSETH